VDPAQPCEQAVDSVRVKGEDQQKNHTHSIYSPIMQSTSNGFSHGKHNDSKPPDPWRTGCATQPTKGTQRAQESKRTNTQVEKTAVHCTDPPACVQHGSDLHQRSGTAPAHLAPYQNTGGRRNQKPTHLKRPSLVCPPPCPSAHGPSIPKSDCNALCMRAAASAWDSISPPRVS
jgi:hypothetical protein